MKLLLTSNGLSNDSIATAFAELVGKTPHETKVAFIPTAANPEREDKSWLINDLYQLKTRGYYVDIVDLPAFTENQLREILKGMDVIFVGGGDTFYLSYWMQKSGLVEVLPELLKTKVYAGVSAGSIIAGVSLGLASRPLENPQAFRDKNYDELGPKGQSAGEALCLVDFVVRPHFNNSDFPLVKKDFLEARAKDVPFPVYAFDDDSALKVVDGTVEVVTEGEWVLLNRDKG